MTLLDLEDRLWGHPSGLPGRVGGWLMSWFDRALVETTVASLELDGDERVLEIGFGPGVGLAALAREMTDGHVVGLDPSPVMHRQAARRNRAAIEAGTVTLVEGAVPGTPFGDDAFDVVVAINTVHHWPDVVTGLDECRRVLRGGGTLAVALTGHVRDVTGLDDDRLSDRLERSGFTEPRILEVDAGTVLLSDRSPLEPRSGEVLSES